MITVIKNCGTYTVQFLEHMLHHTNLDNVLRNGLLSHKTVYDKGLIKQDISMSEVQARRAAKNIENQGKIYELHEFVPLYFNSRNPMLYKRRNIQHELIVLCINPEIINRNQTIFTDGNAANHNTKFYYGQNNLKNVPFELITSGSWNNPDLDIKKENVRKMCSEVLVYPSVDINSIIKIACPNEIMRQYVEKTIKMVGKSVSHIYVEIQTGYFFI